jgi:uncharacterized protein YciI
MALYVLEYRYADAEIRARVRPQHLAYMRSLVDVGTLVMAGPWADQSGALVVFWAEDEKQAWALVEADPYTIEGATAEHRLREWTVVIAAQPLGRSTPG